MWKKAHHSVEFIFLTNYDRQKRLSQTERKRADVPKVPQFFTFSPGLCYDLSKFDDDFTPFFDFERPLIVLYCICICLKGNLTLK